MRAWLASLLVVMAGCSGSSETDPPADAWAPQPPATHVLVDALEPEGLEAPVMRLLGAIASGGPLYGAGEPSIWAALDGTVFVAFPGCDDGPYYLVVSLPDAETCGHGLVYKSTDDGMSFERLNRHPDGRLTDDGPAANGDADVAVDGNGTVYTSNLGGGGIQFHRSLDGGSTWEYVANIVPTTESTSDDPEAREGADRQWLAAAGPGHVINAWMRTSPSRDVAINTTFDGGGNWTGRANFGDGIGWLGTPQFAPDGMAAYIPYTQPALAAGLPLGIADEFEMHVIRTFDGGVTWQDIPTGMKWSTTATGVHWSGGHMAPTLDVTGDGTVVVAMAVDNYVAVPGNPPAVTNQGTTILVRTSSDNGTTWSSTVSLAQNILPAGGSLNAGSRIFPWITGGGGDRFAMTYFSSPSPLDNDLVPSKWSLEAVVCDGALEGELVCVETTIDPNIREGPICTRGSACAFPIDRTLLDFFESDVLPDGRLIVVYPADSAVSGKDIEIRVAVQDAGMPLFVRP